MEMMGLVEYDASFIVRICSDDLRRTNKQASKRNKIDKKKFKTSGNKYHE